MKEYIKPETTIIKCSLYDYIYTCGFNTGLETAIESIHKDLYLMLDDMIDNLDVIISDKHIWY